MTDAPYQTPAEHYREAERRLSRAEAVLEDPVRSAFQASGGDPNRQAEYEVSLANVHALLANVPYPTADRVRYEAEAAERAAAAVPQLPPL
jgi:hypothetical protein